MPANGIMWTLFFAGEMFAPSARVGDRNVGVYLRDHYLGSMRAIAERVAHMDHVLGFDTLNEPGTGYVGRAMSEPLAKFRGAQFSPLDGLAAASGFSRDVAVVAWGGKPTGETRRVNPEGVPIWLPGREDPFRAAGAWDLNADGEPEVLREDYFQARDGKAVEMERDFMVPFFHGVAHTIRSVRSDWLAFAEVDPFGALRGHGFPDGCPERTVNASHWYDLAALVTKRFDERRSVDVLTGEVREGRDAIEQAYVDGLSRLSAIGEKLNGGAPTLVGECGIQYDMNDGDAYARWAAGERSPDIWSAQSTALELMYNALDRLLLSSTQWNYTASNRNDPMVGDGWNQEDLSIWSEDQVTGPDDADSGGRAVEGFCRPYIRAAQGQIIEQAFDRSTGKFEAVIEADPGIGAPSEIYLPWLHFPNGADVECAAQVHIDGPLIFVTADVYGSLRVRVSPRS